MLTSISILTKQQPLVLVQQQFNVCLKAFSTCSDKQNLLCSVADGHSPHPCQLLHPCCAPVLVPVLLLPQPGPTSAVQPTGCPALM